MYGNIERKKKIVSRILCLLLAIFMIFIFVGCEDNSLEARIEEAHKRTEAAQEAYDQAKEKYEDILEDYAAYKESQNYLDRFR